MPTIAASLIAMIAGWVLDALIADSVDLGTRIIVGLVGSTVVFLWALRWLQRLRDG
jgi:uncharacterized membrane protein YeaQ/YmgE (transglycosylase-associated protein family)